MNKDKEIQNLKSELAFYKKVSEVTGRALNEKPKTIEKFIPGTYPEEEKQKWVCESKLWMEQSEKLEKENNRLYAELKDLKQQNKQLKRSKNGFPVNAEPIRAPQRLDLREYFRIPEDVPDRGWTAQQQIDAFKFYATDDINILAYDLPCDYQGTVYVLFECKGYIFTWSASFGSCSECDWLDGCNVETGYEEFKRTITEGNTLQFYSKKHAFYYFTSLKKATDRYLYSYESFPLYWLEREDSD